MLAGGAGLVGVGYEGLTVGELVARLEAMGVTRLVDVRLTPISRKPGRKARRGPVPHGSTP